MFRVFFKIEVRDLEAARAHFNRAGGPEERRQWGILQTQVHRNVGAPNEVTLCHDFDTLAEAKAYGRRERLVDIMAEAGVRRAPELWVTELL